MWDVGRAAVIKMLLAFENGMLPGNLHYKEPNPNSESLKNGTIKVWPVEEWALRQGMQELCIALAFRFRSS